MPYPATLSPSRADLASHPLPARLKWRVVGGSCGHDYGQRDCCLPAHWMADLRPIDRLAAWRVAGAIFMRPLPWMMGLRLTRFSELAASFRIRVCHWLHESATIWAFTLDFVHNGITVYWATVFNEPGRGVTRYSAVGHAHGSSPGQRIVRACHRNGICFPSVHRLCEILLHRLTCEQACTVNCNRYPLADSTGTRTERRSSSPASRLAPNGASRAGLFRFLYIGIA